MKNCAYPSYHTVLVGGLEGTSQRKGSVGIIRSACPRHNRTCTILFCTARIGSSCTPTTVENTYLGFEFDFKLEEICLPNKINVYELLLIFFPVIGESFPSVTPNSAPTVPFFILFCCNDFSSSQWDCYLMTATRRIFSGLLLPTDYSTQFLDNCRRLLVDACSKTTNCWRAVS